MKIAFIGLREYPHVFHGVSGIETRGEGVIDYLAKQNKVCVYTRNWLPKNNTNRKNIQTIRTPTVNNKYLDTFLYSLFASIAVSFSDAKLVFIEGTAAGFFSFIPKLFKKKIITTLHSLEWKRIKWGFIGRFILYLSEYISLHISDKTVAVSPELEKYIMNQHLIKATLLPFYFKRKKEATPIAVSNKYNLKKNNYVLFLGRFTPEKRIEWLINAYSHIKTRKKLVIAGGETHDKDYARHIFDLCKKDNRIILTGYVFGKEKEDLLANCSFLVLPSSLEGCPMVVLEALSYGRLVLVNNSTGLFDNGLPICQFQEESYQDFSDKLFRLLTNKHPIPVFFYSRRFPNKETFFKTYYEIINSLEED